MWTWSLKLYTVFKPALPALKLPVVFLCCSSKNPVYRKQPQNPTETLTTDTAHFTPQREIYSSICFQQEMDRIISSRMDLNFFHDVFNWCKIPYLLCSVPLIGFSWPIALGVNEWINRSSSSQLHRSCLKFSQVLAPDPFVTFQRWALGLLLHDAFAVRASASGTFV